LYSLDTHKFTQVTDGMSDASNPAFDLNGKYLYFLASTERRSLRTQASIFPRSIVLSPTRPYVVVLAKDGASPIPPESDDEKIKEEKKPDADKSADDKKKDTKDDKSTAKDESKSADKDKDKDKDADKDKDKDKSVKVTVDLDGIGNRILSLPIPPRNYGNSRRQGWRLLPL
jgi:tricorn protease